MLVKDGMLSLFKRRRVETLSLSSTAIIDHIGLDDTQREELERAGAIVKSLAKTNYSATDSPRPSFDVSSAVEKVVTENPEFVRALALAMADSAVNATRRVNSLSGISATVTGPLEMAQSRFLGRYRNAPPNRFLVNEALIMKRYWDCYRLAVRGAEEWFGPRKKSRFVREFVSNPAGRARGYSAVDAAINYVHQRRLFKARQINAELGVNASSEGFLHRKRWNAKGQGLLLDLADPFNFADREKLLQAIQAYELNWRDFYSTTDRHGSRFYYPKPEAVLVMEKVGEQADGMPVNYDGKSETLLEAYGDSVRKLTDALQKNELSLALPFVYITQR